MGFDNAYSDARPEDLEARGWKGFINCNHGVWEGESGKTTVSQLKSWYDKGWDIFPHGWTLCAADATEAEIREDLSKAQAFMSQAGFYRGMHFGSPCGGGIHCTGSAEARDIARDYLVASRAIWSWPSAYKDSVHTDGRSPCLMWALASWICPDWYNMHDRRLTYPSIGDLEDAKAVVDQVVATKGIQSFHAHGISDDGGLDIPESYWYPFLDHIQAYEAQGKLEVITFTEWLNRTLFSPGCMRVGDDGELYIQ